MAWRNNKTSGRKISAIGPNYSPELFVNSDLCEKRFVPEWFEDGTDLTVESFGKVDLRHFSPGKR